MNEIFTVAWIAIHFAMSSCPLQDRLYAEKFGLSPHSNCPPSHSVKGREQKTDHYLTGTSSTSAWSTFLEISQFFCVDASSTTGSDCIESAEIGTGYQFKDGKSTPTEVILKWPK